MALGGGIWTAQNKGLPGTYINFSSAARANASLTAGGVVAVPLSLSWGPEETVVTLKAGTIAQTCRDLCTSGRCRCMPRLPAVWGAGASCMLSP